MTARERHAADCAKLFSTFRPNFDGCRNPSEAETILQMASAGFLSAEIAAKIGKTPKAVQKFFRRYDFPRLSNLLVPRREERSGWKGGVKTVKGYLYARTTGHPNASKHGCYVAVHRLVVEEALGRYLLPTEVVDHIDGDTTNNAASNLRVFASNGEHLAATLKGRVPKWSDDGKAALDLARRQPRRTWKGVAVQPTPET